MTCPDVQDANLILRLYELRRESVMREAREFVTGHFRAQTLEQFLELCPMGSDNHRMFRMVASYWEMVGAFVNNGLLNQELFFQTNGEHLVIWLKVEPWIAKMRQTFKMPFMFKNIEELAKKHLAWMDTRQPGSAEEYRGFVRSMQEQAAKSR